MLQAFADMEQGLATAPALFAFEEHPQIGEIIKRRFGDEGDAALVGDLVSRSEGAVAPTAPTSHASERGRRSHLEAAP